MEENDAGLWRLIGEHDPYLILVRCNYCPITWIEPPCKYANSANFTSRSTVDRFFFFFFFFFLFFLFFFTPASLPLFLELRGFSVPLAGLWLHCCGTST